MSAVGIFIKTGQARLSAVMDQILKKVIHPDTHVSNLTLSFTVNLTLDIS